MSEEQRIEFRTLVRDTPVPDDDLPFEFALMQAAWNAAVKKCLTSAEAEFDPGDAWCGPGASVNSQSILKNLIA